MSIVKRTLRLCIIFSWVSVGSATSLAEKKKIDGEDIDRNYAFVVYEKVQNTLFAPLDRLELHMAGNEEETVPIYFELFGGLRPKPCNNYIKITVSELVGPAGVLPAPRLRFQGSLTSDPDIRQLVFEGKNHDIFQGYRLIDGDAVLVKTGRTETAWVTFATRGKSAVPGAYQGTIRFYDGYIDELIRELPVTVIVHDFTMPARWLTEYFPGYSIGYLVDHPSIPQDKRLPLWELHCRTLAQHGCRRVGFYASTKDLEMYKLVVKVVKIEKGYLPALDFSGLDPYMDIARQAGMDGAFIYFGYHPSWAQAEREMTGQEKKEQDRHIWRQWFAYLRSKGLNDILLKTYDEPPVGFANSEIFDELKKIRKLDSDVRLGSFYNRLDLDSFNAIHPYAEMYVVMPHCSDTFFGWIRDGIFVPKPGDIIGYYIPSRFAHEDSYLAWRLGLWRTQQLNVRFFHQWAYDLTHGDYGHINYNAPDFTEIVSTPAWEGTKDGLEDWELCEQLKERIALMRKKGLSKQADPLQVRLDSLISEKKGKSPIHSNPEFKRGFKYTVLSSDVPSLRRAKKIVLELLGRAEEILDSN